MFICSCVIRELALDVDILVGQNFTERDDINYFKTNQKLHFSVNNGSSCARVDIDSVNMGLNDKIIQQKNRGQFE